MNTGCLKTRSIWYRMAIFSNSSIKKKHRHGRLARWIKSRACDVGEANWRMNCDLGEATEGLENELWRKWSDGKVGEWAELVHTYSRAHSPTFPHFTYVTTHSPALPSLYLRHSSFSNPLVASRTSQLILQSFRCFIYVTVHSPTLPSLHLRHSSFSNSLLLRHKLFT